MDTDTQLELLNKGLERAAEQLGDITGPVFELYYQRYPKAHEDFLRHDPSGRDQLEGAMVEQALFCLMRWYESPGEVEIILITTIPHHIETLGVSGDTFIGLLNAVCDIIEGTIPDGAEDEREVWRDLRAELLTISQESAATARPMVQTSAA